jgi:hypothetical protein
MKVRVFKIFGREVFRIESHYEATVSDVVRAIIQNRSDSEGSEYVCACSCDDEEEEEEDEEESDDGIRGRFADMTERIVWDARADDYTFPKPIFDDEEPDQD